MWEGWLPRCIFATAHILEQGLVLRWMLLMADNEGRTAVPNSLRPHPRPIHGISGAIHCAPTNGYPDDFVQLHNRRCARSIGTYCYTDHFVIYPAKLTTNHGRICIRMVHLIRDTSKGFFGLDLNSLLLLLR